MSKQKAASRETARMVGRACLCLHVQRAARALARTFDAAFRPLGLTNNQFSLMMALTRPQPPTMRQVSELLAIDRTTLTACLKVLERRDLVAVSVDRADRRGRRPALTDAGRALLARALPIWKRTHRAVERSLAGADADRLRADLRSISLRPPLDDTS